jgi:uncharacterized membrane protein YdbT with pleckstrin-like domain
VIEGTRRPVRALLRYYILASLAAGPGFIILMPLKFFRYRTLHYEFDDEGMTARWGILFRREVSLTYARIQDIHLVSNVVERWFGLGRIQIQTASGQSGAEMVIEGLPDFEQIRDELYVRMRGARREQKTPTRTAPAALRISSDETAQVAQALREAVIELRAIRELISTRPAGPLRPPTS